MIPSNVSQLLVVVSPNWDTVEGVLQCYERTSSSHPWETVGPGIPIVLGKKGMAWGRGLWSQKGMQKEEGDAKSPAGLFSLGTVFGDPSSAPFAKNMPFLPITDDLEFVDDPSSIYYNQFVQVSSSGKRDWKSSEKMNEVGPLYSLGIVVDHNLDPIAPGMGSAIFIHVWRNRGMGTAGCTAMQESDLQQVVSWLDQKKRPCLLQLPKAELKSSLHPQIFLSH